MNYLNKEVTANVEKVNDKKTFIKLLSISVDIRK